MCTKRRQLVSATVVNPVRWRARSMALLLLVCTVNAARGAEEPPIGHDVLQTVAARRALVQDARLARLNLGVKVHNRVATLWGPVPSQELGLQAVKVLRALPDLVDVRNELQVVPDDDQPLFLPEPQSKKSTASPGLLTTHTPKVQVAPSAAPAWTAITNGKKDPRMPDNTEMEPSLPSLRLPIPSVAEPMAEKSPEEVIGDLQRDKRFNQIRIELRGHVVYLGDPTDSPRLYELARILSRVPGIERVVVKDR